MTLWGPALDLPWRYRSPQDWRDVLAWCASLSGNRFRVVGVVR